MSQRSILDPKARHLNGEQGTTHTHTDTHIPPSSSLLIPHLSEIRVIIPRWAASIIYTPANRSLTVVLSTQSISPASDSSLRFLSQWRNDSLLSRISMISSTQTLCGLVVFPPPPPAAATAAQTQRGSVAVQSGTVRLETSNSTGKFSTTFWSEGKEIKTQSKRVQSVQIQRDKCERGLKQTHSSWELLLLLLFIISPLWIRVHRVFPPASPSFSYLLLSDTGMCGRSHTQWDGGAIKKKQKQKTNSSLNLSL